MSNKKFRITAFAPLAYFFIIMAILAGYYTTTNRISDNVSDMKMLVKVRPADSLFREHIKSLKIEGTGSVFKFDWDHQPIVVANDGVKRKLPLMGYKKVGEGYVLEFDYGITLSFLFRQGILEIIPSVPQELRKSIESLTIPWQISKEYSFLKTGDQIASLNSDSKQYYIEFDHNIVLQPQNNRFSFIAFDSSKLRFTSNSFGTVQSVSSFLAQVQQENKETAQRFFNDYKMAQLQHMLQRFDPKTARFLQTDGSYQANKQTLLTYLAFINDNSQFDQQRTIINNLISKNKALVSGESFSYFPAVLTAKDLDEFINTRADRIERALDDNDFSIFYEPDLLNFCLTHGFYNSRNRLLTMASSSARNEDSADSAAKLMFLLQSIAFNNRASDVRAANRLIDRLIENVVWLKNDLYFYKDKEISFKTGLFFGLALKFMTDNNLLDRDDQKDLSQIGFNLIRGATVLTDKQGFIPVKAEWDGGVALFSKEAMGAENYSGLMWKDLSYPNTFSQRNLLSGNAYFYGLDSQAEASFADKAERVIKLSLSPSTKAYQQVVLTGFDQKVIRVSYKNEVIKQNSAVTNSETSWFYDDNEDILIIRSAKKDDVDDYLITLEEVKTETTKPKTNSSANSRPSSTANVTKNNNSSEKVTAKEEPKKESEADRKKRLKEEEKRKKEEEKRKKEEEKKKKKKD